MSEIVLCWSVRALWSSRRSRTAHSPELEELVERADEARMTGNGFKDLCGEDTHDQEEYAALDRLRISSSEFQDTN